MAIDCRTPAARALALDVAPGEVSWILSETRLWSVQGDGDLGTVTTLLLSCGTPRSLGALVAGAHSEAHSTTSRHGRTAWSEHTNWPAAVGVASRSIDAVVVHVPDGSTMTPAELQRLTRSLRASKANNVFIVDADPLRRAVAESVVGFVLGTTGATVEAAALFADMIHGGTNAPLNMTCLDLDDLRTATGSAERPARLVEALWHRQARRLAFYDPVDERQVSEAAAVAVHPALGMYRLEELRALVRDVGAMLANEDVGLVYSAPMHPFPASWGSSKAAFVRLLCCPRD